MSLKFNLGSNKEPMNPRVSSKRKRAEKLKGGSGYAPTNDDGLGDSCEKRNRLPGDVDYPIVDDEGQIRRYYVAEVPVAVVSKRVQ